MFRKVVLPVLAICGIALAVDTVMTGAKPQIPAAPVAAPARSPFDAYVAGSGIIESLTENVSIGTPVPGLVTDICVKPGDHVKRGDILFKLDDRDLQADLISKQAGVKAAEARLRKLQMEPRPEDIPVAEARVAEAQATLTNAQAQLDLYEKVSDKRAISEDEFIKRRNAVNVGAARLAQEKANLSLVKSGAWKSDIDVADAELQSAKAQAQSTQALLDRLTVKAPLDAQVLQVKIRPGEYAVVAGSKDPLMLLGNIDELAVRVDVDENEAWRVVPGAKARAFLRGNGQFETPLEYVRTEPYIVPKRSLTGDSTERVDTRVLQVIYKFHRDSLPVYVGQQMDVFIEARPVATTTPSEGGVQ